MNDPLQLNSYDYELPEELIATTPSPSRDQSRLLVRQSSGLVLHKHFTDLKDFLRAGDLLVFNDVAVLGARLYAHKKDTGGAVEILVLDLLAPNEWDEVSREFRFRAMTRSSKPVRAGSQLVLDDGKEISVLSGEAGMIEATMTLAENESPRQALDRLGRLPLPPYIVKRRQTMGEPAYKSQDNERYQTVYAKKPGAVAAPTAGLHFTNELLAAIRAKGIRTASITLHVGAGTFRPVTEDHLNEHRMHSETYEIPDELSDAIAATRARGARIVAVGTTTARTLEAEARRDLPFSPGIRTTDIFLYPGADRGFEVVDALITNFHLPRSTLLALVAAFIGLEEMHELYQGAIDARYRFFSYGDACLLFRRQS